MQNTAQLKATLHPLKGAYGEVYYVYCAILCNKVRYIKLVKLNPNHRLKVAFVLNVDY